MNDKRDAESVFAARSSAKVLQRMLSAAAVLFVLCLVFAAPASAEGDAPALPTATVTQLDNDDLTFALNFKADEASDEQKAYYGDWYADFVLTVNKDFTANATGGADGYLSGQYDAWSENWVNVPFENVTINAGESLKIMEYAAELMGQSGLKLTYNDVYSFVKDFNCGVFFEEEYLAENPGLEVTLELRMYNSDDEAESYVIGETYTFNLAAQIDDAVFVTLEDAVADAENGDTIVLLNDVELTETLKIPAGTEVTLDLAGHILSGFNGAAEGSALIENKGDLTIKDSLENGKITSQSLYPDINWGGEGEPPYPTYANNVVNNLGTLILESGTIESMTASGGATYAIDNHGGGSIFVNGGKIYNPNNFAIRLFAGDTVNSITVNNGDINGTRAIWIQLPGSETSKAPVVNVTVNGGTLTGSQIDSSDNKLAIYSYSYGNSMKNVNITITGGTFNGDVALNGGRSGAKVDAETLTITDGEFNGYWGCVYSYAQNTVAKETMSITGGIFTTVDHDKYTDLCEDLSVYLADGYACAAENGRYTVNIDAGISGPAKVTAGVPAVFTASPVNIADWTDATYAWSVDGTALPQFTDGAFEYKFTEVKDHTVLVTAVNNAGEKAAASMVVNVTAAKSVPDVANQKPASFVEGNKPENFNAVNFSTEDAKDSDITLTVKDLLSSNEDQDQQEVEKQKAAIPVAKEIVASYSITANSQDVDIHDLEQMAVVKITVVLDAPLGKGEKLQAYRFNQENDIKAMPLKTTYTSPVEKDGKYAYEVTIHTPGFSAIAVGVVESVLDFGYSLGTDPTSKVIIGSGKPVTVPIDYTNGAGLAPTSWEVTVTVSDASGNAVENLAYSLDVSSSHGDSAYTDQDANEAGRFESIAVSTLTSSVNEVSGLFTVTITGLDNNAKGDYTITVNLLTGVSKYGQDPAHAVHDVVHTVSVENWLILKEDNIDSTSENPWGFDNKVWANLTVANPGVGSYTSTVDDTLVKRNLTSAYGLNITESGTLSIVKVIGNTESPAADGTTISKNAEGKLVMTVADADANADHFILVFVGNKVGDVANIAVRPDKVNVIDVDYILHQCVEKGYIKSGYEVYADVNRDADINTADAQLVFKVGLNKETDSDKNSVLMVETE